MEFRDYAAKETAALVNRLLVSQVEASVQQLRTLREALEAASRSVEDGSTPSPEADQEVQELIRKLNTAAGTAARVAAQKVQKEAQTAMEAVQDDLNVQRSENERLTGVLNDTQTDRDFIREELQKEREQLQKEIERAEALDRDLDAAIEAHAHVDAQRLEAEDEARKQGNARATAESDLMESRGLLDATVAEAARLSGDLDAARAEAAQLNDRLSEARAAADQAQTEARSSLDAAHEELRSERERAEGLTTALAELQAQADILLADLAEAETQAEAQRADLAEAHGQTESVRNELADAHAHAETLRGELGEAHRNAEALGHQLADLNGQLEALRHELTDARSQADALRADLQRETERADAADHDLDAAIEAHGNVDAARMEAEAECRRQVGIASAAQKELADVRALLDASVAQVAKIGMQLDANAAENGTLAADLTAAHAELQSARTQREATTAQLDASRARVQTLERNQAAHEGRVRQLETALSEATAANDVLRAESAHSGSDLDVGQALADAGDLREQVARLGSLLDSSSQAVEELAEKTTITDLFAALVRHLAGEFSRVALFRLKANRLEGEDQIGFDETTDVTKLVLPLSVDSLITRAASSGTYEQLTGDDLDDNSRAPFGGTPVVAIAMPIAFQGETLAVVYADSDRFTSERGAGLDASIGFARLLVRTAGVLLMRLSQELKMLSELRDYAAMLLQEAQEMYAADTEAEKSDDERRSRLKDTIECARQLYAQRAALEGSAAATLFDDRIAAALEADGDTSFARDLAAIGGAPESHAEPRRKAEAS
jgi:chromosome segregation ATPase